MKLKRMLKFFKTLPLRLITFISAVLLIAFDYDFQSYAAESVPEFSATFDFFSPFSLDPKKPIIPRENNFSSVSVIRRFYCPTTGSFIDYDGVASADIGLEYYAVYDVPIDINIESTNASGMPQNGYYNNRIDCGIRCFNKNINPVVFSHAYIESEDSSYIRVSSNNTLSGTTINKDEKAQIVFSIFWNAKFIPKRTASASSTSVKFCTVHMIFYERSGSYYSSSATSSRFNFSPSLFYGQINGNINFVITESNLAASNSVGGTLQDIEDEMKKQREEDREDAGKAGDDAGSLVTDMQDLENKWEILWLPIKFTKQVLSVFTGGSASQSYIANYYNVSGFRYDEDSGFLVPIRDPVIPLDLARQASGGATITFPEYTLPVLNVKLWDSYTYDLSTLKEDFSVLFDALYVFITILEVYWFISFIRDKYEEVFN